MNPNLETSDRFPIRVSPNGRYFVKRSGRPFFWLGDTQWQLFRDYSLEDVETILKDRAQKGFSVIQVMVTGFGDGTSPNVEGQSPWRNNDPAMPNEAYFARVDAIVKMARELGLALVFYLCHAVQREYVRTDNARAYAHWVAERYRDQPHLLWALVSEVPIADHLAIIHELVGGLREGAGDAQLISYHPDPVAPALSSGEIHAEDWLAFNMIQTWNYYEGIYGWVTHDYRREPAKPVVMAEGAYEEGSEYGFPITPWLVRKQAYWSYLAGGSHSYGHNHMWRVLPDWKAKLDAPGAQQMRILKDFFSQMNWWELTPDQRIFTSQTAPGTTLNLAARSEAGDWILAYLSSPSSVWVDLSRIAGEGQVEAAWVDPRSGVTSRIGVVPKSGSPSFTTPAGWEDALLWITNGIAFALPDH